LKIYGPNLEKVKFLWGGRAQKIAENCFISTEEYIDWEIHYIEQIIINDKYENKIHTVELQKNKYSQEYFII